MLSLFCLARLCCTAVVVSVLTVLSVAGDDAPFGLNGLQQNSVDSQRNMFSHRRFRDWRNQNSLVGNHGLFGGRNMRRRDMSGDRIQRAGDSSEIADHRFAVRRPRAVDGSEQNEKGVGANAGNLPNEDVRLDSGDGGALGQSGGAGGHLDWKGNGRMAQSKEGGQWANDVLGKPAADNQPGVVNENGNNFAELEQNNFVQGNLNGASNDQSSGESQDGMNRAMAVRPNQLGVGNSENIGDSNDFGQQQQDGARLQDLDPMENARGADQAQNNLFEAQNQFADSVEVRAGSANRNQHALGDPQSILEGNNNAGENSQDVPGSLDRMGLGRQAESFVKDAVDAIALQAKEQLAGSSDPNKILEVLASQVSNLEQLVYSLGTPIGVYLSSVASRADGGGGTTILRENRILYQMCEETREKYLNHRKAFDELLSEKQSLTTMLKEDEEQLRALQEKVQNPELSKWIEVRAAKLNKYFETPETDAVAYYAKKIMGSKMQIARKRLSALEHKMEQTVDSVMPARYGSFVALMLTLIIVGFPVVVTAYAVIFLTKVISFRQRVLLGNLFFASFFIAVGIVGLILRQDPLKTLYDASENQFILLQIALSLSYACFMAVLTWAIVKGRARQEKATFISQMIFYAAIGVNYHNRVWAPSMLGLTIDTNAWMYFVYVIDFCAMAMLTVSSVVPDERSERGLPRHAEEPESASESPTRSRRRFLQGAQRRLVQSFFTESHSQAGDGKEA